MKFNKATLYKVPFDNTYKNVVDYHKYGKVANVLTELTLTATEIQQARRSYFGTLSSLSVYSSGSAYKSVKIIGKSVEVSIAGNYDNICEYNYIVFQDYDREMETYSNELYCFVRNFVSNNDSNNPSTTIICEIDYWTQYIDTLSLNTPHQFEEYAHTNPKDFNGKADTRVPTEFVHKNTFDAMFDDAILFLVVDYDPDHPIASVPNNYSQFDTTVGRWIRYYIPILAMTREGEHGSLILRVLSGVYYDSDHLNDYSEYYAQGKILSSLDSQYIFGARLTVATPAGIFAASSHTVTYNNKLFFKADAIENNYYAVLVDTNKYVYGVSATAGFAMYFTNYSNFLGLANTHNTYLKSLYFNYRKNINLSASAEDEIKLLQYPYHTYTLYYKGKSYNITPEPNGSSVAPNVAVTFRKFDDLAIKIENGSNIGNTTYFTLGETDTVPVSVDEYQRYKETQQTSDTMKATTAILAAGLTSIGTLLALPSGGASVGLIAAGALVGGSTTMAKTTVDYIGKQITMAAQPDKINAPSNNSLNHFASIFPMVKESVLRNEDKELVCNVWKHYGYPVFDTKQYKMARFWYDYKQFKDTKLPNITNPVAKDILTSMFNNGVTIWHCNTIDSNIKSFTIGDYSKNNPSCTDCTEVTV